MPGIEISLDALFGRAAALRQVELVEPRSVIGKTTVESIQSGAVYGYSSLIDGMCDRFEEVIGESTIVATGGLAGLIAPVAESIEHEEPWLTLHGLRLIWEKNRTVTDPMDREQLSPTSAIRRGRTPDETGPGSGGRDLATTSSPTTTTATRPPPSSPSASPGSSPGTETGQRVAVAGRLMLRRVQGKLAFGTLADSSGRIQLFAPSQSTPDFERFCELNIGDWIGVSGEVMTTRRGELSVRVDEWKLLAPTRRSFPDKWHGISDPDMRYRQRYVDLWVTDEARATFLLRSQLLSRTRRFMEDRGYLEVETPGVPSDPRRRAGQAVHHPPQRARHRALPAHRAGAVPEAPRRRWLREGVRDRPGVPQRGHVHPAQPRVHDARVLRGVRRLPRPHGADRGARRRRWPPSCAAGRPSPTAVVPVDLSTPGAGPPMAELTSANVGEDVSIHTPIDRLRSLCDDHGVPWKDNYGPGKLLLELYEKTTEHQLWDPTFVMDYPAEVSPLSRAAPRRCRAWSSASRGSWSGASCATGSRS